MNKRILVYLGHPAQFHFFKYTIERLQENGCQVKILLKTKDVLEELVREWGYDYENIQKSVRKNNIVSIALASLARTCRVCKIARKYKPDLMIGGDASIAQVSKLLHIPGVTVLEDDIDIIGRLANVTFPYSNAIVVPSVCRVGKWGYKKVSYYGYMKLAYLHPSIFIPDIEIKKKYVSETKYCLVRFSQLAAYHDTGVAGLNIDLVLTFIELARKNGYTVYISSEKTLDKQLRPHQLKIRYNDIHHVMFFASMLISDSQSMSVEAAILGLPSIRFSDFAGRISVLEELEHNYDLTFGVGTAYPENLLQKVNELFGKANLKGEFQRRRMVMLRDKINVTSFFVWFIENYPASKDILKNDPSYQYRFK